MLKTRAQFQSINLMLALQKKIRILSRKTFSNWDRSKMSLDFSFILSRLIDIARGFLLILIKDSLRFDEQTFLSLLF